MKLNKVDTEGNQNGKTELPKQFQEQLRKDIIKRAVNAFHSSQRQKYGAKPDAGNRHSADLSKKRRDYRGVYDVGRSRTPRKVMSRNGSQFNFEGARVSHTRGGRRPHPPKAEKDLEKGINKKEKKLALRSALASTIQPDVVKERGHNVPDEYPFILENEWEDIAKTQDVVEALHNLGFEDELERTKERKVRSGKGKNRGRKYKTKTGILFVTGEESKLHRGARNIPGVEVTTPDQLNAEHLAPGTHPGRLTLYTESALNKIQDEELYR